jgi:hypothetical protein
MKKVSPAEREQVRVLAIEIGARNAARKLGLNEDTVCSWSLRYDWKLPKRDRNGSVTLSDQMRAAEPASGLQSRVGDVLLASHKELESATRTSLSRATMRAAAEAESLPQVLPHSGRINDVAAAASRLFGWDRNQSGNVTLNQLVVTTEQLQQIRALREVTTDSQSIVLHGER